MGSPTVGGTKIADMRYNVAQLLMGPTGAQRAYDFEEEIRNLEPELEPLQPLSGSVVLMRTSQGILVIGTLQTMFETTCRRCLEPCDTKVQVELEEEFYPAAQIAEEELDEALLIDEHHILDLTEVIRQELLLAEPTQALCSSGCAGLCPHCGGNRNLGKCQCDEPAIDLRWSALQALLPNELDSEERSD